MRPVPRSGREPGSRFIPARATGSRARRLPAGRARTRLLRRGAGPGRRGAPLPRPTVSPQWPYLPEIHQAPGRGPGFAGAVSRSRRDSRQGERGGLTAVGSAAPARWVGSPRDRSDAALAQARLAGPDNCLGPVGDLQLEEGVRDVVAHRLLAHVEPVGDLRVVQAPGYKVEDLPLPRGELGEDLGGSV